MCGISGTFGKEISSDKTLNLTLSLMQQRGPDANGSYVELVQNNNIQLLHSRLAIIDLDNRSNQPFYANNCVLVFNGEIYNYLELKNELIGHGHSFASSSDTEVIIKAYLQWGVSCFNKFEGMWAIALFDKNKESLVLSRDRFGEKPFYYCVVEGTLYFGSEVKFIRALLCNKKIEVDIDKIKKYLVYGFKTLYNNPSETFYSNIKLLPPAHYAVVKDASNIILKRYYATSYNPVEMSMEDAIYGSKYYLEESLKIRLRSDVPLAFCLSGGIDSSTLVGMAVKNFQYNAHTFSIIDSDKRYDERDYINSTVDFLNCKSSLVQINKDNFFDRLKSLVEYHDSPVSTISYYIHSFLSEEISKSGYKIAISGTAADEIFTGYYDHYNLWLAEMSQRNDFDELVEQWRNGYGRFVRNPALKNPKHYINNENNIDHFFLNSELFNSFMIEPLNYSHSNTAYTKLSKLRNRMLNELNNEIVPVILKEDDANSMMFSIENRSPFLDTRLVDFLYSIPDRYLVNSGNLKWLLREVGKGLYPENVRTSKEKKGFNASIDTLIDFNDSKSIDYFMADSKIFDIVDRQKIRGLLNNKAKSNSISKFLFSFISAKTFMDLN
jgi:asparagine synthase (glutamine-hydrolysing)